MAKVYSITAMLAWVFTGGLVFVMNLETLSHIGGLIGALSALFFGFLAYRKKLLSTGFTLFRNQYRGEMDEFKRHILNDIGIYRDIMNRNNDQNTKAMNRIVELYESTHRSVEKQANTCKLIQVENSGAKKIEELWKKNMKKELDEVKQDVEHIRKSINHVK